MTQEEKYMKAAIREAKKAYALEDLLSVVSIGILFFFRRFMLMTKPDKDQNVPKLFGVIKASQSGRPVQTERADAEKAEGSKGAGEK